MSTDASNEGIDPSQSTPVTAVSIIIPAFNEEEIVAEVISQIEQVLTDAKTDFELLVVDDGSTDRTAEIVQRTSATLIRHESNRGYGAALKTGIRGAQSECICMLDADGTYPIDRLCELIQEAHAYDMVVGARSANAVGIPWIRRLPKWLLTKLANYLSGERIPDLNSGFRVIRRGLVMENMDILPDQFSFTTTITLAAICSGYRVKYVPIDYFQRVGKSKLRPLDALGFITLILRIMTLFHPLRVFLPISLLLFSGGMVKLGIDIFVYDNVEDASVILLLGGLQTLLLGVLADLISFMRRRNGQLASQQNFR